MFMKDNVALHVNLKIFQITSCKLFKNNNVLVILINLLSILKPKLSLKISCNSIAVSQLFHKIILNNIQYMQDVKFGVFKNLESSEKSFHSFNKLCTLQVLWSVFG